MRQKPRRLPFPAFRFLRQRSVVNRRRMRLQHLLLLALRMLVLAALCFAIAQPKLFLPRAVAELVRPEQPAAGGGRVRFRRELPHGIPRRRRVSRLDDARQRALDLLHDLPADSQVAVLDTGADGGRRRGGRGLDSVAGPGALAHQRPAPAAGAGAAGSPG